MKHTAGYRGLLDFDPETDTPQVDWRTIPDLLPCVFEGMQEMKIIDFASWDAAGTEEIRIYTDGSSMNGKAAWSCAIFAFSDGSWGFIGYMLGPVPPSEHYHLNAMTAELFALFTATWWILRFCVLDLWKGNVSFLWDSTVAGHMADGSYASHRHVIARHLRQVQQALETFLGRERICHQHVPAHKGIWENELVDAAAKWALLPNTTTTYNIATAIIIQGGLETTSWLWLYLQQNSMSMPQYEDGVLQWSCHTTNYECDFAKTLRTGFLPHQVSEKPAARCLFALQIGTYNCLSLGSTSEDLIGAQHTVLGKIALMRERADTLGFHVMGIQEARTEAGQTISSTHLRISSGRQLDGTLGVELWIALKKPFRWDCNDKPCFLASKATAVVHNDPRLLIVRYHDHHLAAVFVVAHSPHNGYPLTERRLWWNELQQRLQDFSQDEIVMMIDANSRFSGTPTMNFGDLPEGHPSQNGVEFQDLAANLNLIAPATFTCWHWGPSMTWNHPNGKSQSRIDYVLVPRQWQTAAIESWVEPDFHSGFATLDHFCAALSLRWTAWQKTTSRRHINFDREAMADPGNRKTLESILMGAPPTAWEINATEHATEMVEYLQHELREHFPQKKKPRSFTLASEETLETFHEMTHQRRQLRTYRAIYEQLHLRFWFDTWLNREWRTSDFEWAARFFRYHAMATRTSHHTAKNLYRQLRKDKRQFLEDLAPTLFNAAPHEVYQRLQPLLPNRKRQQGSTRPLTQLKKTDGTLTATPQEVETRWIEHFAALEAGETVNAPAFIREAIKRQQTICMPSEWTAEDLPSLLDLEDAIRRIKQNKAPGPDNLPGDLFRLAPAAAARMIFPLLTKFVCRLEEPVQFKGGTLFALHKGRGPHNEGSSFRSILLLSSIGKVMRASMRHIINEPYLKHSDTLQLAGKPGQTVVFGAQTVRHFLKYHQTINQSAGVVFCDIAAAFYQAIRELALGVDSSDLGIATLVKRLGLPPEIMPALHAALEGRHCYATLQATPARQAFLRESLESTWFAFGADNVVATHRGSRPGDSWADVIFNVLFSQVLARVEADLRQRGLLLQLPRITDCNPWHRPASTDPQVSLFHATWADDLALLVSLGQPDRAPSRLANAASTLFEALKVYGMKIAFGKGKTEAMLLLRGKGAVAMRRQVFCNSSPQLPVLEETCCTMLPLITTYKHLGGLITTQGTMIAEISARIAKAKSAFGRLSKLVFRATMVSLRSKVLIFRATVLSTLVWGSGAWPSLSKQELQLFASATWDLYRKLLPHKLTGGKAEPYTHLELLEKLRLPHPEDLLHEQRARHFATLVQVAPPAVWAALYHDNATLTAYQDSLCWVRQTIERASILPPLEDWDSWTELMNNYPGKWKRICRTASARHLSQRITWAKVSHWRDQILFTLRDFGFVDTACQSVKGYHWCLMRNRQFTSMAGWFLHSHHKHDYRSLLGAVSGPGTFLPLLPKAL